LTDLRGVMRVCYFGTYESEYPRNRIFIDGLRKNGVEVEEIHFNQWERGAGKLTLVQKLPGLVMSLPRLLFAYAYLLGRLCRSWSRYDAIIVGYVGQLDAVVANLARKVKGNKPVVFNPLVSLHDTLVSDRGLFRKASLAGKLLLGLDRRAVRACDLVVLDTEAHARFFAEEISTPAGKLRVIPVGAEEQFFVEQADTAPRDRITVLFVGKLIPLHGVEHILEAAKLLEQEEGIVFEIVGKGQLESRVRELVQDYGLENVKLTRWIPYAGLPRKIAEADLCLGIFGESGKARRVIPNKVFQALAAGKPVITGDSEAARELLEHRKTAYLCQMGSGRSIAQAILELVRDEELRRLMARNARDLARRRFSPAAIGREVKQVLEEIVGGRPCMS